MKMKAKHVAIFLIMLGSVAFPTISFGASTVKFLHVISIYSDDKRIGLKQPEGVACNDNGALVVADTGNGRLLRFTFQAKELGPDVSVMKVPQSPQPIKTAMNTANDIFTLDGERRRIIRLTPEGRFRQYLDPKGLPRPTAFVPRSFHIDRNDNIYILDILSERVLVLDLKGEFRREIRFPKDYGFISDLTTDFKGNVLLVDSVTATVFSAGKGDSNFVPLTKNLKETMRFPTDITTDDRGRLYLVDRNGGRIVILGQDGSYLGRISGHGWKEGLLNYPSQMCLNGSGDLFVADTNNNRVQIFTIAE